jgi:hypothetical protein
MIRVGSIVLRVDDLQGQTEPSTSTRRTNNRLPLQLSAALP